MKYYQIYLITNLINNKKYVGQSIKTPDRDYLVRFKEHIPVNRKCRTILESAIKHYGIDNFKLELIEDDITEDLIDAKEQYYILKYNSFYTNGWGYNMTYGGQGIHGYHHTLETKAKISNSAKRTWCLWRTDNVDKMNTRNLNLSHSLKGIPKSKETRDKLSKAAKKRASQEGYVNNFQGRHHTEDTKKKLSLARSIKIGAFDVTSGELQYTFSSAMEAAKYLVSQGITHNVSCFSRILKVAHGTPSEGKIAYGYIWKFI